MISPRQHDVVNLENLERKSCLPGVNLGSEGEEIETFEAKQMSMLCLQCSNYINLTHLQRHRSFHDALSLFQHDIQTKPIDLDELSSQRTSLVKDLSNTSVNQSALYLKELRKIDVAYEILKSEMYGRLNKAKPNLTKHVDVKIRSFKKILNNGTSMGVCQSSNEKWKSVMEDAYSYEADYITNGAFFAVYDGYNGHTAAKKCAKKLHDILKEKLINRDLKDLCENGDCQLSDCFQQAYKEMDKVLLLGEEETSRNRWSGCSATTGVLGDRYLHVANVGNVKAILIKRDTTIQTLTEDHTPENTKEKRRMKKTRDIKKWIKTLWVNGIASATRGLGNHGDPMLKLNVINTPGLCCMSLDGDYQIILIGSGGFWEVFDENESLVLVQDWLEMKDGEIFERNGNSGVEVEDRAPFPESLVAVNVENDGQDIPPQISSYETESKIECLLPINREPTVDKEKDERCRKCCGNECNENGFSFENTVHEQDKIPSQNVSNKIPEQPQTESLFSNLLEKIIIEDSCRISMEMSKHLVNAALNGGAKSNVTVMVVLCNGE